MPHKLPRRAKTENYLDLTQQREINLPVKPLANANVHRLLKSGTCSENKRAETRALFQLLFGILEKKEYVRFDFEIRNNGMKIFGKYKHLAVLRD